MDELKEENIAGIDTTPRDGQKTAKPVASPTSKVDKRIDPPIPKTNVPTKSREPVSQQEEQNFIRRAAISHRWHDTEFKASDARNSESRKPGTRSSKTASSRVGEAIRRLEKQTKSKLDVVPNKRQRLIINRDTSPKIRKQENPTPMNEKASTSSASQKPT